MYRYILHRSTEVDSRNQFAENNEKPVIHSKTNLCGEVRVWLLSPESQNESVLWVWLIDILVLYDKNRYPIYGVFNFVVICTHYGDVVMGTVASQIISLTIVYSTVYSGADQRKHQSFASLAFVRGITGEFPAQMASNEENVSIWWRHHVFIALLMRRSSIQEYVQMSPLKEWFPLHYSGRVLYFRFRLFSLLFA